MPASPFIYKQEDGLARCKRAQETEKERGREDPREGEKQGDAHGQREQTIYRCNVHKESIYRYIYRTTVEGVAIYIYIYGQGTVLCLHFWLKFA